MARKSAEQRVMDIDAQIAMLRERKREALAQQSVEARKAESHARHVIGALVLEHFGGDWKLVDMEHLESLLNSNHDYVAGCTRGEIPLDEAKHRMREWESAHRAKSGGAAAAEAPEVGYVSDEAVV